MALPLVKKGVTLPVQTKLWYKNCMINLEVCDKICFKFHESTPEGKNREKRSPCKILRCFSVHCAGGWLDILETEPSFQIIHDYLTHEGWIGFYR